MMSFVLLALFHLAVSLPLSPLPTSSRNALSTPGVLLGATFDACNTDSDCLEPLGCKNPMGTACQTIGGSCACLNIIDGDLIFEECDSRFDCTSSREQCVEIRSSQVCVSNAIATTNFFNRVPVDPVVPRQAPDPSRGRVQDSCRKSEQCVGDLYCAQFVDEDGIPIDVEDVPSPPGPEDLKECNRSSEFSPITNPCFCFGRDFDETTRDCRGTGCAKGEVCANDTIFEKTFCIAATVEAAFVTFMAVPVDGLEMMPTSSPK